ncbi:hypothetical protein [uncultured Cocleimonas sp.]|uniref:hypothetical protein n=1 Tax=uncultured Cocleimonas sp. TaxID=1051587 RepID=UPI00260AA57A|nr:hypothetical protein [uncultured Cocleimonas sp.]
MKNSNSNSNNNLDRKFEKQVSHLSGFIGMPMWNGRNPTLSEIREYDRRLLERQSMGFESRKSLLKQLSSSVSAVIVKSFTRFNSKDRAEDVVAVSESNLTKQTVASKVTNRNAYKNISKRKDPVTAITTSGSECCG